MSANKFFKKQFDRCADGGESVGSVFATYCGEPNVALVTEEYLGDGTTRYKIRIYKITFTTYKDTDGFPHVGFSPECVIKYYVTNYDGCYFDGDSILSEWADTWLYFGGSLIEAVHYLEGEVRADDRL